MPKNYKAIELSVAVDRLLRFISDNDREIASKGLNATNLGTALSGSHTTTQRAKALHEDKKVELMVATRDLKAAADALSQIFASDCDLLIGAFGKGSSQAKQVIAIRKNLNKRKQSSEEV
jgi:hypothetical protein